MNNFSQCCTNSIISKIGEEVIIERIICKKHKILMDTQNCLVLPHAKEKLIMSNRKLSTIVIFALAAVLLVAVPASAKAITQTITFHNESLVFPDQDICGAGDVTVTLTYNGVLHTTEFTDDHPNAGTSHSRFKMNGTVTTVDMDGNVLSNDRFVKTIFHSNVNRQNLNNRFNFIINGLRADGSRHRFHLIGHFNLSASGNLVEFSKLSISCP